MNTWIGAASALVRGLLRGRIALPSRLKGHARHLAGVERPLSSIVPGFDGVCNRLMSIKDPSPLDTLSPAERSERMGRVRGKNTKPELVVRSLVHGLGFRYRLHGSQLPGRPDLVFTKRRKVIFVHGCFWHRHEGCPKTRLPKTRLDFWVPKLNGNRLRDEENQRRLLEAGWEYLIIWECEVRSREALTARVLEFLGQP